MYDLKMEYTPELQRIYDWYAAGYRHFWTKEKEVRVVRGEQDLLGCLWPHGGPGRLRTEVEIEAADVPKGAWERKLSQRVVSWRDLYQDNTMPRQATMIELVDRGWYAYYMYFDTPEDGYRGEFAPNPFAFSVWDEVARDLSFYRPDETSKFAQLRACTMKWPSKQVLLDGTPLSPGFFEY